jgi:hypothetical protein
MIMRPKGLWGGVEFGFLRPKAPGGEQARPR